MTSTPTSEDAKIIGEGWDLIRRQWNVLLLEHSLDLVDNIQNERWLREEIPTNNQTSGESDDNRSGDKAHVSSSK